MSFAHSAPQKHGLSSTIPMPTLPELRQFAMIWAGVGVLLFVIPLLKGEALRWWPLGLSVGFLAVGLLQPGLLKGFYQIWSRFGKILGLINTRVFLFILFFGIFTPVGMVLRLLGYDPLKRCWQPQISSYWQAREVPPESMTRQF